MEQKRIGIWIRVSTDFQVRDESPEHHEQRARYYAKSRGWNIVEVYRLDAISGKTVMEHPETQRMLADIRSGHITGLVFSKLASWQEARRSYWSSPKYSETRRRIWFHLPNRSIPAPQRADCFSQSYRQWPNGNVRKSQAGWLRLFRFVQRWVSPWVARPVLGISGRINSW